MRAMVTKSSSRTSIIVERMRSSGKPVQVDRERQGRQEQVDEEIAREDASDQALELGARR